MHLLNVGNNNSIASDCIIAFVKYGNRASKRIKQECDKRGCAIDVSGGDAIKTLIIVKDLVFLSSVNTETLELRYEKLSKQ